MSKFINDRWVWAPQYLSAGTCSGPNVSFSSLYFCDMTAELASVREKRDDARGAVESCCRSAMTRLGNDPYESRIGTGAALREERSGRENTHAESRFAGSGEHG